MPSTGTVFAAVDREGYVVLPGVLDTTWIRRLLRAFDTAPPQGTGTQHVRLTEQTPDLDAWKALTEVPAVHQAAEHVVGAAFHVRDLHGRNALPGGGRQGLHVDSPGRTGASPYFVVTALFMLDEFNEHNGATRVVPGTHVECRPIPKSMAQPHARHPRELTISGQPGGVLVLNGHVWHSGTENRTGKPRRAAQMVIERGIGPSSKRWIDAPPPDE
jgi:hypothetical protein